MGILLDTHVQIFIISACISLLTFSIAYNRNFFKLSHSESSHAVSSRDVFGSFLIFLGVHLIIAPASAIYAAKLAGVQIIGVQAQGWVVIYSMYFACFSLFFYTSCLSDATTRESIWPSAQVHKLQSFYFGALSLLIGYPLVIAIGQFVRMIQISVFGIPEVDQIAVEALKLSLDYPLMSALMMFGVVCIVPIAEEVLFRGYLQGWMRGYLQPKYAIILTSIIFSAFHYSFKQGWSNIELLLSLLILSMILGILYEKQRTLWAPIGLHMAFNLINAALLIMTTTG